MALSLVLLLSFAASLGMAFNLDAIVVSFNTSDTVAGLVASTEMGSIAAGTLLIIRLTGRLDPHRVFAIGALTIVTFNIVSIFAADVVWLALSRIPVGFALGAVSATVMATAGRSHKPEMTFGVIVASMSVMGIFIAFVLPRALSMHAVLPAIHAWSALDGLYIVYVLCSVCALLFIHWTPARSTKAEAGDGASELAPLHRSGWLALFGLAFIFFGHGLLALFLVKVGRDLGLAPEVVGYVFMAASALGIALPIAVGYMGTRVPTRISISAGAAILVAAALIVANTHVSMVYFVVAPVFAVLPAAIFPIFLGALSRLDLSGRLVAANQAFLMLGGALAPLIGGALSDYAGYPANGVAVACFVGIGVFLGLPALARADALRS